MVWLENEHPLSDYGSRGALGLVQLEVEFESSICDFEDMVDEREKGTQMNFRD